MSEDLGAKEGTFDTENGKITGQIGSDGSMTVGGTSYDSLSSAANAVGATRATAGTKLNKNVAEIGGVAFEGGTSNVQNFDIEQNFTGWPRQAD